MLTENAMKVLEKRYLTKDEDGNAIEDVNGMFMRVAQTVARAENAFGKGTETDAKIESLTHIFYEMMANLEFLPNSPTLMNAGRPLGQLSACFVLPVEDSMEGIFETIKNAAVIHKSGGGTGFDFSRIRPDGSAVNSTGGVASGPVSFIKVFDRATEVIKQGGVRRGANMGVLRVDHPDIRAFISCKKDGGELNNFNISVAITDEFMRAFKKGGRYGLINPWGLKAPAAADEDAREIFDLITQCAWRNGEPGVIFIDRMNDGNVLPRSGRIESTNPCGEQPLLPYESCNLGSINLLSMIKKGGGGVYSLDEAKLLGTVRNAVRFLDNVIEINRYPLDIIKTRTENARKIGLGVMGFADMLCRLSIPYDSEEGIGFAGNIMRLIRDEARRASSDLAIERGVFPLYDESVYKGTDLRLRNATLTTIAPTGTLSLIAGVSSGIEPLFAISYVKNILDGQRLTEVNPVFLDAAKSGGFYSDELMQKIAAAGSIRNIAEIPEAVRRTFVTAHDIDPARHVKMQAAFQRYTDNAVSKTVNLPFEATVEDARNIFLLAYESGCKGLTIYRDKSRGGQVLNIEADAGARPDRTVKPRPRPVVTTGFTEKVPIGCGKLYITVNYDEDGICEVFTNTGKAGGCPSQSEATARLVSVALRSGVDPNVIISQLKGIRCPSTIKQPGMKVLSCPDAIARMLEKVLHSRFDRESADLTQTRSDGGGADLPQTRSDGVEADLPPPRLDVDACGQQGFADSNTGAMVEPLPVSCPECGSVLEHEGGCVICRECGYSKCG